MARKTARPALVISAGEREELEQLRRSRTAPKREVERASILLRYNAGEGPTLIHQALGLSRVTIYKCIDKALAAGVAAGLKDRYHRPREPVITEAATRMGVEYGLHQTQGSWFGGRVVVALGARALYPQTRSG